MKYTAQHVVDLVASKSSKNIFEWKHLQQMTTVSENPLSALFDDFKKSQSELTNKFEKFMKENLRMNVKTKRYEKVLNSVFNQYDGIKNANNNLDIRSFYLNTLRHIVLSFQTD